jgi:hypothetical protein
MAKEGGNKIGDDDTVVITNDRKTIINGNTDNGVLIDGTISCDGGRGGNWFTASSRYCSFGGDGRFAEE